MFSGTGYEDMKGNFLTLDTSGKGGGGDDSKVGGVSTRLVVTCGYKDLIN